MSSGDLREIGSLARRPASPSRAPPFALGLCRGDAGGPDGWREDGGQEDSGKSADAVAHGRCAAA